MLRASARLGVVVTSEVITANEQLNARKFYFYDPEGHLLSETELTTAASPAIAYEYIWFGGEPVAQIRTATNQIHFYFNDHLGTPILTTDGNGVVDWQVEREPFGKIFAVRTGAGRHQPLSLPGQEDDGLTDRSYNMFRWYRPGWGRYTQADPIGVTSDLNVFRYSLSNPVTYSDPLGLDVRLCCRSVASRLLNSWDHCYVESNTGGRRQTWGLYLNEENGMGEPLKNREPKNANSRCTSWYPESCEGNKCWTPNMNRYPVNDYSEFSANRSYFGLGKGSGRNSNTFARCLWERCGPKMDPADTAGVTTIAPGWSQPCPNF